MSRKGVGKFLFVSVLMIRGAALPATAQSFSVQCPTSTITHPSTLTNTSTEPNYTAPTAFTTGPNGFLVPTANVNGAIKCQQISGGDGYSTMANGTQTFMFSFGPLSGLADIAAGLPGTEVPRVQYRVRRHVRAWRSGQLRWGRPTRTVRHAQGACLDSLNGAVGLAPDLDCIAANAPLPQGLPTSASMP